MGRYGTLDYARLVRLWFALDLTMSIKGVMGEFMIHVMIDEIDPLIDTAFFTIEADGLVIELLSPFIFGIHPLTE